MPQIIREIGLGQRIGTGLGTGVSQGLQQLAARKLEELSQRTEGERTSAGLQALGFSEDESKKLANFHPKVIEQIVKQRLEAPSQELFQKLIAGTTPGLEAMRQQPALEALPVSEEGPISALQGLKEPLEAGSVPIEQITPEVEVPSPQRQIQPEGKITPIDRQISKLGSEIQRMQAAIGSGTLKPRQTDQIAKILTKKEEMLSSLLLSKAREKQAAKRFDARQKLEERRFDLERNKFEKQLSTQERKELRGDQKEIDKETLPTYDKLVKEAKAARENDMRLERIDEINEKGNVGFGIFNSIINTVGKGIFGIGINLDFLMTADAQELKKLSTDFLKNVKDVFGARVTQKEVEMFLKTVPTLFQSKEGRARVINNLKAFNNATKLRFNIMNDIIKENNGRRPRNLSSIIEKRAAKELDSLAEAFKSAPTREYKPLIHKSFI